MTSVSRVQALCLSLSLSVFLPLSMSHPSFLFFLSLLCSLSLSRSSKVARFSGETGNWAPKKYFGTVRPQDSLAKLGSKFFGEQSGGKILWPN